MRDCSTNRAGFDRVLMAVAATFLTVSATSALAAQSTTPRASAAELAIDAAVPRPEPANVPPPTIGDFKMDTTATVPDAAKAVEKPAEPSPAAKAAEPKPPSRHRTCGQRRRNRRASGCDSHRARRRTRQGAGEGQHRRSGRPAGRRPPARHARRQIAALFRPQERARCRREVLLGARLRAAMDASRQIDRQRQGRDRPFEGCRRRGPQSGRLSGAGFCGRRFAGPARRSRTETDREHARLCATGPERPDALVAGRRRHPVSRAPDRSGGSARQHLDRQGRVRSARRLQPAAQALQGIEGQARRAARPGRRTDDPYRRRSGAGVQGRHQEAG